MKRSIALSLIAIAGLSASCFAQTDATKPSSKQPASKQPEGKPGMPEMTPEQQKQMEAYMKAATPGKEHEHLMKAVGTWEGKIKHWMKPDAPAAESTCVTKMAPVFEGRFLRCETEGEMPGGMGMFRGLGLYGFDNVSKQYQSTWIDNMGTGMMTGTGEVSSDGKTMTWTMNCHCPITGKPMTMREVDRTIDENHSVLEMYGPDDKGKEFKMMEIAYTRRAGGDTRPSATAPGAGRDADATRPVRGTNEPRR
jgi:hypothetical protein